MKKVGLAFSLLVLILSSCSSSDSETTSTSDLLVKKAIVTTAEGSLITLYSYDGKKITGSTSNDVSLNDYTYTGDLITTIKHVINGVVSNITSYEYNSSNQLITSISEESEPAEVTKKTYVYNVDGTISVTVLKGETEDDLVPFNTQNIYFIDNSINKIEITNAGSAAINRIINLAYDAKNNPFKNVIGYDKLLLVERSLNNNVEYRIVNTPGVTTNYISTYVYDTNDFPLASLKSAGSTASNVTTEFFYE